MARISFQGFWQCITSCCNKNVTRTESIHKKDGIGDEGPRRDMVVSGVAKDFLASRSAEATGVDHSNENHSIAKKDNKEGGTRYRSIRSERDGAGICGGGLSPDFLLFNVFAKKCSEKEGEQPTKKAGIDRDEDLPGGITRHRSRSVPPSGNPDEEDDIVVTDFNTPKSEKDEVISPKVIVVRSRSEPPQDEKIERKTVPPSLREMRKLGESRNLLEGPEDIKSWKLPSPDGAGKWNIYYPEVKGAEKYRLQRQQSKLEMKAKTKSPIEENGEEQQAEAARKKEKTPPLLSQLVRSQKVKLTRREDGTMEISKFKNVPPSVDFDK